MTEHSSSRGHGEPFAPAWWLPGPHLQTLWQPLFRWQPRPATVRERVNTPDGDFLDIDWFGPDRGPVALLLHGLSGSSRSPYIRGMQVVLAEQGWRSAALNFRGCSGEPNRTSRGYHSGETGDLDYIYETLRERLPAVPLAAIGYSLGGNMLLKWLGERGSSVDLTAAVAVSVPLRLGVCASRLDDGWSRLYRNQLLRELKDYIEQKRVHLATNGLAGEAQKLEALGDLSSIRSFWEYDDRVVARLYGFAGAEAYYRTCSARPFLRHITCPTLLIHARNDPFMTEAVLPDKDELSPAIQFELCETGGHVGFVGGRWPWNPGYWLEQRAMRFLHMQGQTG